MLRVRLKTDLSFVATKDEMRPVICPESRRATDELLEFRGVELREVIIIKEHYRQPGESRGIDPGHKVLEVFADSFKSKFGESGENRASREK